MRVCKKIPIWRERWSNQTYQRIKTLIFIFFTFPSIHGRIRRTPSMAKYINIRSISLLLSLVFLVLSLNGFVAKQEISKLGLGVTNLGHDLLHLRSEAIAFNTNGDITPVELFEHLFSNKKQLTLFIEQAKTKRFDLFNLESTQIKQLMDAYTLEHLDLSQSIDNLIRLVMARNQALSQLSNPRLSPLEQKIDPINPNALDLEKYQLKNNEIAHLLNGMLLGHSSEFVEETENTLKEMGLSKLNNAFIFCSLALINFIIFVGFSSWQRVRHLKRLNKELKALSVKAEKSNQAKSTFLAIMSHELRTPMNGVLGMAELILDETKEKTTKKNAQVIIDSGEHLMTILNDILDVSKTEQSEIELEQVRFKLNELLRPVINALAPIACDKKITLDIEYQDIPSDISLLGDCSRIRQVLFNLIGNAIKFTQKGGVKIICECLVSEGRLIFWIKDTGVGIPEEKLETIFEPFRQAEASTTRRFGGTGLGLTIVKNMVLQMKGTINVTSEKGKGSTFIVSMPIGIKTMKTKVANKKHNLPTKIPSLTILLADDNAINATVGKRLCEQLGHQVDLVENGKKAIERLKTHHYDLILMDKHMPEMDGIDAIKYIRQTLKLETLIFACTADAFNETHEEFLKVGANHVLLKPMKKSNIKKSIERFEADFIRLHKGAKINPLNSEKASSNKEQAAKKDQPTKSTKPLKSNKTTFIENHEEISTSLALQHVTDKKELVFLLNLMINEFDKAAIALVQGMNKADLDTLFKTLHTIKGTALQLELTALSTLAKENEAKAKSGVLPSNKALQSIIDLMLANNQKARQIMANIQTKTQLIEQA